MTKLNTLNIEAKLPGTTARDTADIHLLKMLIEKGMTIDEILNKLYWEFLLWEMTPSSRTKYKQRFQNLHDIYINKTKPIESEIIEKKIICKTDDIFEIFIKTLFQKSKRKKGYIYLCELKSNKVYINDQTGAITSMKTYKYGRTVNMEERLHNYGDQYSLLKSWNTNHVKLREWLIHNEEFVIEQRFINGQHQNDEHVIGLQCQDMVEFYATAKIKVKQQIFGEYIILITPSSKFKESCGELEIDIRNLLYAV